MAMKHAQPSGKSPVERCDLSRLNTFRRRLSEGSVYSLSGFEVTRSNNIFPLSDSPVSIRFNDRTSFPETTNSKKDTPTELFRLCSHEQL
ncbi:hypothetical protein IGI04_037927 [Brassica rapa subsp. trilocularis]|uniref:Uncharacterized protein n=1 Tax=Brassica rapa subsp. trilocularis TaxID=1813537 RepID=A0ABQ7LJN9_BRACM|nr:hypothetical protein IGI04_037927 [Brassica rapa subsp. trilocularis]